MRIHDRQPFFRYALLFGGIGLLCIVFTFRMLVDGERARDVAWPAVLAVVCSSIAVAAGMRGWAVFRAMQGSSHARVFGARGRQP